MTFEYLGWHKAADLIYNGISTTMQQKCVAHELERPMQGRRS
jgi:isocitrate dehydrogenase